MNKVSIFSLIAIIALVFFGVGYDSTAQVPNFNPCTLTTNNLTDIDLSVQSTTTNSATFTTDGSIGKDVDCPFTMTVYVGNSSSVSPSNYSFLSTAGTMNNPGKFYYNNVVVSGLSSKTQYYAVGCVTGLTSNYVCSSAEKFKTDGSSNSGGSSGSYLNSIPKVGKVTVTNNNGSSFVLSSMTSVGCGAQVWFEYGMGSLSQRTPSTYMAPTLQSTVSSNLGVLPAGTYSVRGVAQNCSGITYGPVTIFSTIGYTGSIVPTNYVPTVPTNYYNPYYSGIPKYNSYATDSTRHSRTGYWESNDAYNDAANKNYGYYKSIATKNNYNSNTEVVNQNSYSTNGIYAQNPSYMNGQQPYPYNYYRGNGGDLRVWDRPYNIVSASNYIRGGVAEVYTTRSATSSPAFIIGILILASIVAIAGYRLGRDTRGY